MRRNGNILYLSVLILTILTQESLFMSIRVSIVGGGLSGLGSAFQLLRLQKNINLIVNIYDSAKPELRNSKELTASTAAAGLMHPLSPSGSIIWNGEESFDASLQIIHEVEHFAGKEMYRRNQHIIRPCLNKRNEESFHKTSKKFPNVKDLRFK